MSGRGSSKDANYVKWLRINSAQRLPGPTYSDSNFVIDLGQSLQKVKRVSVVSCQFTNNFYNVFETTTKFNNWVKVVVQDGASQLFGTHFVRIEPGYYNSTELGAAIDAAIQAIDGTHTDIIVSTYTLNTITNKYSLELSALGTVGTPGGYLTTPTAADLANPTSSQWLGGSPPTGRIDYWPLGLLGFDSKLNWTTLTSPATATFHAIYQPSLNNPSLAYITSQALSPSNSFDEKGSMSNVLIPINITVPFGALQTFECKQDILCEVNYGRTRTLDRVDIQLVDHDLDLLDLSQCEFNLDLKVWLNHF